MSDFYDVIEEDTGLVLDEQHGSGIVASVETYEGETKSLRCFFEAPGLDVVPDHITTGIISLAPRLHFLETDVQEVLGRKLSTRDIISVREKRYRIQDPHQDGFGFVSCKALGVDNG